MNERELDLISNILQKPLIPKEVMEKAFDVDEDEVKEKEEQKPSNDPKDILGLL